MQGWKIKSFNYEPGGIMVGMDKLHSFLFEYCKPVHHSELAVNYIHTCKNIRGANQPFTHPAAARSSRGADGKMQYSTAHKQPLRRMKEMIQTLFSPEWRHFSYLFVNWQQSSGSLKRTHNHQLGEIKKSPLTPQSLSRSWKKTFFCFINLDLWKDESDQEMWIQMIHISQLS